MNLIKTKNYCALKVFITEIVLSKCEARDCRIMHSHSIPETRNLICTVYRQMYSWTEPVKVREPVAYCKWIMKSYACCGASRVQHA